MGIITSMFWSDPGMQRDPTDKRLIGPRSLKEGVDLQLKNLKAMEAAVDARRSEMAERMNGFTRSARECLISGDAARAKEMIRFRNHTRKSLEAYSQRSFEINCMRTRLEDKNFMTEFTDQTLSTISMITVMSKKSTLEDLHERVPEAAEARAIDQAFQAEEAAIMQLIPPIESFVADDIDVDAELAILTQQISSESANPATEIDVEEPVVESFMPSIKLTRRAE